jgi:hypothetical protein
MFIVLAGVLNNAPHYNIKEIQVTFIKNNIKRLMIFQIKPGMGLPELSSFGDGILKNQRTIKPQVKRVN